MYNYIQLLRVKQYVKNTIIFLPPFFGLKIINGPLLLKTFLSFLIFSIVASGIYIFNDIIDIETDKKHPVKCRRPLPSGRISKKNATILEISLIFLGATGAFFIGKAIFVIILSYFFLNILYSLKLKHIPIIDVFVIAFGFYLRLLIGSYSSNTPLSTWIVIMTFLLGLFLALAKRRDDVIIYIKTGEKTREVIDGYNLSILNVSISIMASVIIVVYIMYTVSPSVVKRIGSDKLYVTSIFVILGIMRYLQITFVEEKSGSPTEILLKDRFIQLTILVWILSFIIILY